jgi:hypothetical protein
MQETVRFLLSVWAFVTGVLQVVCFWLWNLRWWQFWLMMTALTGAWIVHMTRKRRREETRAEQRREKTKRYWPTTPLAGLGDVDHLGKLRPATPSRTHPKPHQKH